MKNEIIYTDDYALIVSDEVKSGDVVLVNDEHHFNIIRIFTTAFGGDKKSCKKVIAYRPLNHSAWILESVPLLPEFDIETEETIEAIYYKELEDRREIAKNFTGQVAGRHPDMFGHQEVHHMVRGFLEGYNRAKETYKYTEEDLIKAIDMATTRRHEDTVLFFRSDEIIQSLQQPKRPKYFEMEVYSYDNPEYNTYPKTKLISKGQTELVGSYIY
jgi:hypothetical protein